MSAEGPFGKEGLSFNENAVVGYSCVPEFELFRSVAALFRTLAHRTLVYRCLRVQTADPSSTVKSSPSFLTGPRALDYVCPSNLGGDLAVPRTLRRCVAADPDLPAVERTLPTRARARRRL
jgi:hypothetical protein